MSKRKIFLFILILSSIVIAFSCESLLNKIVEANLINLKCTITFEKNIDISKLQELEKEHKIHIDGIEVSFKDDSGEIATSIIVFNGYETLMKDIATISELDDLDIIGITGIYAIAKYSEIEKIKQDDTVFAVESNISLPQFSSLFGNYRETKTWELNNQKRVVS